MGTRADFYVGRGESAEWLGSVGYDGYPESFAKTIATATTEEDYRKAVAAELSGRDDASLPSHGWPWPWDNSSTSDYAYAFDGSSVYASRFGGPWFIAADSEPDDVSGFNVKAAVFPDMRAVKSVTLGHRSGAMFIGTK